MLIALLTGIFFFALIVFTVSKFMKEKNAETAQAQKESDKSDP